MKTVDEVISNWTDEERENLKDLISECKKREESVKSLDFNKVLNDIDSSLGNLEKALTKLEETYVRLEFSVMKEIPNA